MREAKALVISGWSLARGRRVKKLYVGEILAGKHRAPDPWYRLSDNIVVRRLSPNARKIEVKGDAAVLLEEQILRKMGHELANVHTGTGDAQGRVRAHFSRRDARWLQDAAKAAAKFVSGEYEEWSKD